MQVPLGFAKGEVSAEFALKIRPNCLKKLDFDPKSALE
jgi:hypothetical protein